MRNFGFVFAVLVALFVPAEAQRAGQAALSQQELQRIEVKNKWVAAAQNIYDRTHDAEAKDVLDNVLQNLVSMAPVFGQNTMKVLEPSSTSAPFTFFFSITLADATMFANYLPKNAFASYQAQNRLMVVRENEPCSPFWKGMILLHEGHHAYDLMSAPYDWTNPKIFSEKEKNIHNFQNRPASKLGGEPYALLLNREITRIRLDLKKQTGLDNFKIQPGAIPKPTIPSRASYYPELDKIQTPALSQMEKNLRQTMFWIHAVFRMYELDRGPGESAESGKTTFMLAVYNQNHILQ